MLHLTENASTVIKNITGNEEETEAENGLRISQQGADATELALTTADAPEPGDQVVEDGGARVFLEETAAQTLDDKVLDAQVDESGGVQFVVAESPDAPSAPGAPA